MLCWACAGYGQSNLRCTTIPANGTPVRLDSLHLAANTITFPDFNPGQVTYTYNPADKTIAVQAGTTLASNDSVQVCYRVYAPFLNQRLYVHAYAEYDSNALLPPTPPPPIQPNALAQQQGLIKAPGLQKNGSLTRGFTMGNNQSLFWDSRLQLDLSGQLTDDITVEAQINDQNLPYQPEGNSDNLQNFDKVFITLRHKNGSALQAGDVVLRHEEGGHFLRYLKNVQGGQLLLGRQQGPGSGGRIGISAAKGQFASIAVPPIDGVAGPYRLRGPNGERFIIVIANSEKVFVDGQQLQRGAEHDYTIDYNLGELTFTNRIVISRYSRIRVDFEYAAQNYSRVVMAAAQRWQGKRLNITTQYYSEKDNPRRPLAFNVQNDDFQHLSLIGDDLSQGAAGVV